MPKIIIHQLTHCYSGRTTALKDVELEIRSGMYGLLGPNGAGKTSLIRILVTLLKPTSGQVTIDGLDLIKDRKRIRLQTGYLPQEFTSFPRLTVSEFLDYSAGLKGIQSRAERQAQIEKILEDVGLFEARNRLAAKLSGGMKRRLGIAQTLIGDPPIMIIDEPTVGLDPEERVRFRNILSELSRQDKLILLSTHIVGDISSTCSRIALLNEGRIVFEGPPEDLVAQVRGKVWKVSAAAGEIDRVKSQYPVMSAIPLEGGYLLRVLADQAPRIGGEPADPNLEDAYVSFMQSATGGFDALNYQETMNEGVGE
ncbi:MAG: multidrug ABC transporter ATP-binding protein [Candidatus Aminicenantes bacterium RBG_13_62_12]|nr:MAG: multidrug ABC transporter ATP-binding protein [Candidatus Aminicenantes bacterium RBG_13_62_12]